MSDWQECPFLEMTSGARKFGVPQSTLWQRPPGPTLAASPRSPIFTSMFLFRKKLPGGWGTVGGGRASRAPGPRPALTRLQVPVHDVALVQVLQAADQAPQVVARLGLRQRLPHPEHVGQGLRGTQVRAAGGAVGWG